jgi:hypothetical protein
MKGTTNANLMKGKNIWEFKQKEFTSNKLTTNGNGTTIDNLQMEYLFSTNGTT